MKKRNWISLVLIFLCLAVLAAYRAVDQIRTDSTSPVITAEGELPEFSARDPREALLRGVTARDDRDGDVTASLVVESVRLLDNDGTAAVTCAAFDQAGNVAKLIRQIRFVDYEAPRFKLNRPLVFTQNRSDEVLSAISASDMLDGNISHRIRATVLEELENDMDGVYDIRFTVTNSLGDTVELVLPVERYVPDMFEGTLSLTDYLIYLDKGSAFDARSYLRTLNLSQEEYALKAGLPEGAILKTFGFVNTNVPGIYTVEYRISCNMGTELAPQIYTARSKLIVIVEG
jgi:hypothetical protein